MSATFLPLHVAATSATSLPFMPEEVLVNMDLVAQIHRDKGGSRLYWPDESSMAVIESPPEIDLRLRRRAGIA